MMFAVAVAAAEMQNQNESFEMSESIAIAITQAQLWAGWMFAHVIKLTMWWTIGSRDLLEN